ncbi:MAG: FKBP-type peptidyl-prolyl cis-trans isomerase [Candidatus Anammoxibacter sp.]
MEILIIFCWVISVLLAGIFFLRALYKAIGGGPVSKKIKGAKCIVDNTKVTLLYTILDRDRQTLDSKYTKEPFTYIHGKGELLAGFEKRLTGLCIGSKKKISVPVNEAYGKKDPDNIKEVEKPNVPDAVLTLGSQIIIKEIEGGKKPGTILEVKEKTLVLDYNHRFAGMKLVFDIEILDVQDIEEKVEIKEDEREKGKDDGALKVADGMTVKMTVAMFGEDGKSIELPNAGDVTYVHGTKESFSQVIKGLQKKITGFTVGKHDGIILQPDEAYGQKDPKAVQEVDKEEIFSDNLKVGAVLKGIGPEGGDARIDEVKESAVILDFNHPLAGKKLKYNIRIIDIAK